MNVDYYVREAVPNSLTNRLFRFLAAANWIDMLAAPYGEVIIASGNTDGSMSLGWGMPGARWDSFTYAGVNAAQPRLAFEGSRLHFVHAIDDDSSLYRRSLPISESDAAISQVIAIPAGVHKPTLSLWYQFEEHDSGVGAGMHVTIAAAGSGVTEVISATTHSFDWYHAWADLSPWAGKTITLTIEARMPTPSGHAKVRVDEITIGEWRTPVPLASAPPRLPLNTSAAITIAGQNFIKAGAALPQVFFNHVPASSVKWLNEYTLVAQAPPLPWGNYDIHVVNPGGQAHVLPEALYVGFRSYLPLVNR